MMLMRKFDPEKMRKRAKKVVELNDYERPSRFIPVTFAKDKDKADFINYIDKQIIRKSSEYREYIQFLKSRMNMNHCAILENIVKGNGKKYSIEIHHEPFSLFSITEAVVNSFIAEEKPLNPYEIALKVMEEHFDGNIGLVPLSATQHELVENGKIFIPLNYIYHRYDIFYKKYEDYIEPNVKELIKKKIEFSIEYTNVVTNKLEPTFVYIDVDGFEFPEIPEDWGKAIEDSDE